MILSEFPPPVSLTGDIPTRPQPCGSSPGSFRGLCHLVFSMSKIGKKVMPAEQPESRQAKRSRCAETSLRERKNNSSTTEDVAHARRNFCSILGELLRLSIIGIKQLTDATDVHRLRLSARMLQQFGVARWEIAAILALDWAVRSPELSSTFLMNLRDNKFSSDVDADLSAIEQYRVLLNSKEWRSYWKGPSKLNLLLFARNVTITDLMALGHHFEHQFKRMRVTAVLQLIREWSHIGPYLSYNMLRCVAAAMKVRLRDAAPAAAGMSALTHHLANVLGLPEMRKELRRLSGVNPCDGLLGFFLCETAKLLKETGVLKAMQQYQGKDKELIKDLAGDAAEEFLKHLKEFGEVPVPAGAEAAAQNAAMPEEFNLHQPLHTTTDTLQRWKAVAEAAPR